MTPFSAVWPVVDPIKGWLHQDEAALLYALACSIPENQVIVEVGSYHGRSTVLLAHSGRKVHAIDPFESGFAGVGGLSISEDDAKCFGERIAQYSNVTWHRCTASATLQPAQEAGLVFIDGDHTYPHPLEDCQAVLPWCAAGALIAFHDYLWAPGVKRSVDDILKAWQFDFFRQAGSLCVLVHRGL